MKLRNKKTGGIDDFKIEAAGLEWVGYTSLKEFCEDYEDYEEPEGWWFIDMAYEPHATNSTLRNLEADRQIGNYFETKEAAEKAVEKLKAWKRLRDRGFDRVFGAELVDALCGGKTVEFKLLIDDKESIKDIKLIFGGEE